jgi:hypothetical protein
MFRFTRNMHKQNGQTHTATDKCDEINKTQTETTLRKKAQKHTKTKKEIKKYKPVDLCYAMMGVYVHVRFLQAAVGKIEVTRAQKLQELYRLPKEAAENKTEVIAGRCVVYGVCARRGGKGQDDGRVKMAAVYVLCALFVLMDVVMPIACYAV